MLAGPSEKRRILLHKNSQQDHDRPNDAKLYQGRHALAGILPVTSAAITAPVPAASFVPATVPGLPAAISVVLILMTSIVLVPVQ